eukprot:g26437.t1
MDHDHPHRRTSTVPVASAVPIAMLAVSDVHVVVHSMANPNRLSPDPLLPHNLDNQLTFLSDDRTYAYNVAIAGRRQAGPRAYGRGIRIESKLIFKKRCNLIDQNALFSHSLASPLYTSKDLKGSILKASKYSFLVTFDMGHKSELKDGGITTTQKLGLCILVVLNIVVFVYELKISPFAPKEDVVPLGGLDALQEQASDDVSALTQSLRARQEALVSKQQEQATLLSKLSEQLEQQQASRSSQQKKAAADLAALKLQIGSALARQEDSVLQLEANLKLLESRKQQPVQKKAAGAVQAAAASDQASIPVAGDVALGRVGDSPARARQLVEEIVNRRYGKPVEPHDPDPAAQEPLLRPGDVSSWKAECDKIVQRFQPLLKERASWANPATSAGDNSDITLVSGVYDLGRGNLQQDGSQFHRKFKVYQEYFERFLQHTGPKVVFLQHEVIDLFTPHFDKNTYWVPWNVTDFQRTIGGSYAWDRLQFIRQHKNWRSLTGHDGWLSKSPQAQLEYYNPLVMSKNAMLAIAAELNPFATTNFLFIDGGHQCMNPSKWLEPNLRTIVYQHMKNKFLCTYYWYGPANECHGFRMKELKEYLDDHKTNSRMKVVRGGILGGPSWIVDLVDRLFTITMNRTLESGLMGTEETLLSILLVRFPELFAPFSNDDACDENLQGDHACKGVDSKGRRYVNRAGNCAIFDWVYDGPPPRTKHMRLLRTEPTFWRLRPLLAGTGICDGGGDGVRRVEWSDVLWLLWGRDLDLLPRRGEVDLLLRRRSGGPDVSNPEP